MYLYILKDKGYEVKLLAASKGYRNSLIVTMELTYPRFIHSELKTHRVFSTNSASSRAIPTQKIIKDIQNCPASPLSFKANKPGMVAGEELKNQDQARDLWNAAAQRAIETADLLNSIAVHKETVNRILEPFVWMKTIVTSSEWKNFFKLRCAEDAQPEFQHLARMMKEVYEMALALAKPQSPYLLHLPYIHEFERQKYSLYELHILSVARCAVVSYDKHEGGEMDFEKACRIFLRLINEGGSMHASPFEHIARSFTAEEIAFIKQIKQVNGLGKFAESTKYLANYIDSRLEFRGNIKGMASLRWELETNPTKLNTYKIIARDFLDGKTAI